MATHELVLPRFNGYLIKSDNKLGGKRCTSAEKCSQEYKQEAVQLVRQSDIPLAQVAKNLGINPNILRRWGTEISNAGKNAFTGNGTPRDLELARLKRELQQVKQERDFLKEAAAYFARTSKWGTT